MDFSNHTGVTNNFLHSLFSQCNVTLNGVTITQASIIFTALRAYGTDTAANHLSNAYWYLDTGNMQPVDPSAKTVTATANWGFILRWNRISGRRKVQIFGRLYSDICNMPLYLVPDVRLQNRLTKARPSFYLMNKSVN